MQMPEAMDTIYKQLLKGESVQIQYRGPINLPPNQLLHCIKPAAKRFLYFCFQAEQALSFLMCSLGAGVADPDPAFQLDADPDPDANYFRIHWIRMHNTGIKAFPVRTETFSSPADFPQN
jgi:hypothetical protein